jgi:hypothetical protein
VRLSYSASMGPFSFVTTGREEAEDRRSTVCHGDAMGAHQAAAFCFSRTCWQLGMLRFHTTFPVVPTQVDVEAARAGGERGRAQEAGPSACVPCRCIETWPHERSSLRCCRLSGSMHEAAPLPFGSGSFWPVAKGFGVSLAPLTALLPIP